MGRHNVFGAITDVATEFFLAGQAWRKSVKGAAEAPFPVSWGEEKG